MTDSSKAKKRSSLSLAEIRRIALAFPGVEEGTSYGTPAFRVRKKLLARINEEEDALVLRVQDVDQQEALTRGSPKAFFITDHYAGYPYVLAHRKGAQTEEVREVFEAAWRAAAPKSLVKDFDG